MTLSNKDKQARRADAQKLNASVHVGKVGVAGAADELKAQLKARKLVKVRLLPSATEGGKDTSGQAEALAQASGSELVEVRGHTAVFWKA